MSGEGDNLTITHGDYVAGLVDGEGCFYVNIYHFKKYPSAVPQTRIHLYIKLREDDLVILEQVQEFLGIGHIYYQAEKRKHHQPCYRYEINKREELKEVIKFFDKHPLHSPKKARDLDRIREMLSIIDSKEHLKPKGIARIKHLKQEMHT